MRVLIWGAGAIGGTLGAHLARAAADVTMVDAVAEHVDAIARNGLRITPRVTAIRDAWRDFEPDASTTPNIWGFLWGKEAYGAMLFATALTNESIADALVMPDFRPLYIALAREILAVAAARRVQPEA